MGAFARVLARSFGYDVMRLKKSFRFEATLARLLRHHSFDAVIDVGANQGWFSKYCLRSLPLAEVWAFEPASALADKLEALARTQNRLTVSRCALGDEDGSAVLNLSSGSGVYNSLNAANPAYANKLRSFAFVGSEAVQVTRLDACAAVGRLSLFRRMLLKIDTQGHDLKVLKGATQTLERAQAVIVELPFQSIYESDGDYRDILAIMDQAGFDIYSLAPISVDEEGRLLEADGFFVRRPTP